MAQFDFSVYDHLGQLATVVEAKSQFGVSREWASQLRRNLLAHGGFPRAASLLVATPEKLFLWNSAVAGDPLAPPDFEINAEPLFRAYLPSAARSQSRRSLNPQVFEMVVHAWLSDLTRGEPISESLELVKSGFMDSLRQGRIEYQDAA